MRRCRGSFVWAGSLVVAAALVGCQQPSASRAPVEMPRLTYPVTRQVDQVDDYHGVRVADPYRWLEDDNSPETAAWVQAQNAVTMPFLARLPHRDRINARLTKLWNYERYGLPYQEGGRYFYSKNDGLQNQSVLYWTERLDGEPRVLLDPNQLSDDGTVALAGYSVSHDGRLMAYGLSGAGSDWIEYRVRDIDTGTDRDDHLKWIKFSGVSWTKSNDGFYYSRYDEPPAGQELAGQNYHQKLYFHRLGTPQSEDRLIYHRPAESEKDWMISGGVTDDGEYLIIGVSKSDTTNNCIFYQSLAEPDAPVVELLNQFDAQYSFIDNDGPVFWLKTDLDAPRGRVIAIDTRRPDRGAWKEIIPESGDTLQGVSTINNQFIATYLKDAHTAVRVFDLEGRPVREVALPTLGTAGGFGGKRRDTETFYQFTSFNFPATIYRYDAATGRSTEYRRPKVDFNPADYEVKQVFYHSKDGTRVPMFIAHRKGLKLNGANPTYLYGYGGFDISLTPYFSVSTIVWLDMGGVYAMPNLRGGGEYGKAWHDAGRKLNKQNVFDDFIAAAEWLIANRYTSPRHLGIGGGSNGGLLVGACMTQRPELFAAALPAVGVLDMLRFNKFTIGHAWVADYGSPENPEEFRALYAYSPLHNLKKGTAYPATLITTADHDDRVVPAHSFKFAAALQAAHSGPAPVLIRIETKAGHGAGKPTAKRIEELTDQWAFLGWALQADASKLP
mgnify:CR=1 FL=1